MENTYSHDHLVHAHHTGIIIGSIVGSCAITLIAAISLVASSPKIALEPLNIRSGVAIRSEAGNVQSGVAAYEAAFVTSQAHDAPGAAGQTIAP